MMTFHQFQKKLTTRKTRRGRVMYCAPENHLIFLQGELFSEVIEADHDKNWLDISQLGQFIDKNQKKDWKLLRLVEVE